MEVVYGGNANPIATQPNLKDKLALLSDVQKFEQKMVEERTNNFKYVMQDYDFKPLKLNKLTIRSCEIG